ncbi:MAG TPA: phytanoyl-CoA dioxygenase family protein [Dehalococcoidia bacterium]|nr:phytanoyl-CoA dioxygenase family protein [Dehalococcoidia bacterium]
MVALTAVATVEEVLDTLDRDGYAIVEGVLTPDEARAKRDELTRILDQTPHGRNDFEGFKTRRIYALFAKTRCFDGPATHPLVLGVLDRVLGSYQLSAPQAIEIAPGETAQNLHADDGVYPLPRPHQELIVNTMWALDDFTVENGATHVVPGSHKWTDRRPDDATPSVQAVMPAGALMFFLGSIYHGGGANRSERPRLGVILEYCAGWLRPQENHFLAVPKATVRGLAPRLQELLGYSIHGTLLGGADGRHPRKFLDE